MSSASAPALSKTKTGSGSRCILLARCLMNTPMKTTLFTQVEAQTAAYRARIDEQTATSVRNTRNKLLADTDWIVIMHTEKGTNIPATVEIYRQALRDITDHANFPHLAEDDWPTKP